MDVARLTNAEWSKPSIIFQLSFVFVPVCC
jgi:hypothetical protein